MNTVAQQSRDWQAGALAAMEGEPPPFGCETHGCNSGFDDSDCEPQDRGSDEPLPGLEHFEMAHLKQTLIDTAARIAKETKGECRVEALVSSDGPGGPGGFLVFITVAGETFMGNAASLDGAELEARLKASPAAVAAKKALGAGEGSGTVSDKYDEAVAYLTEHPSEIENAWVNGGYFSDPMADDPPNPGAALFQFCTPTGGRAICRGCPTMIRAGRASASTRELTEAIRADERLPSNPEDITVDDLPVFAEWQRRIDKELNRT